MQKLIKWHKPNDLEEKPETEATKVNGHYFIGWRGKDGRYYEHDLKTGEWWLLADSEGGDDVS